MNQIRYHHISMSSQVFLILTALLVVVRFFLLNLVVHFNINGYGGSFHLVGTWILYLFYLLICAFFFFGCKFFSASYDQTEIVYRNRILRRTDTADLNEISRAVLNKRGVYLYRPQEERFCFFLPFRRLGYISPVDVDGFYRQLKASGVKIEKTFTVLPGCGRSGKIIALIFSCLALLMLGALTQSLALTVAIIKSL